MLVRSGQAAAKSAVGQDQTQQIEFRVSFHLFSCILQFFCKISGEPILTTIKIRPAEKSLQSFYKFLASELFRVLALLYSRYYFVLRRNFYIDEIVFKCRLYIVYELVFNRCGCRPEGRNRRRAFFEDFQSDARRKKPTTRIKPTSSSKIFMSKFGQSNDDETKKVEEFMETYEIATSSPKRSRKAKPPKPLRSEKIF